MSCSLFFFFNYNCSFLEFFIKSPLCLLVFSLTPSYHLLSSIVSDFCFFLSAFSNSHIFHLLFSTSLHAPLIMNRKLKLAKEVPLSTLWNATIWPRKRKKRMPTNEVLSEINNAVCTVLKDFSEGGVFLYGPQQKCGWGGGGVLVARPPLLR